ncbi:MAG: tRNA 2-thiouridine(34) synthase MnmA [Bellilinea sp.]
MTKGTSVAVAMSGGVDSSVAAALLVEQGYEVTGVMLRLWSEPGKEESNRCCTPDAMAGARRVAAKLGIPFYALNSQDLFHNVVVQSFMDGYRNGITPNPCILCNQHIRWGFMYETAREMGAEFMATGHYAQVHPKPDGSVELRRGLDPDKDQSYVMSVLPQEKLRHTLFPVGGMAKPEVRQHARRFGLTVADRADSQDLCFLAGQDYRGFLARYVPEITQPGKIVNADGRHIGEHQGLAFYTIGQRKGLGIAAPRPLYVLEKNLATNELVVGDENQLGRSGLTAGGMNWIAGAAPAAPFEADVKIRYRAALAPAVVTPQGDDQIAVHFKNSMRDITIGQRVVIYNGEVVLGGGIIQSSFNTIGEPA